jgi:hypothetical protein
MAQVSDHSTGDTTPQNRNWAERFQRAFLELLDDTRQRLR